jgi:DNA-binding XRE family transcriptional regulator
MTLLLGNKIKTLRRARGIMQEQLDDAIGISFQAASKRENNIALPDITLAPSLASYFGVTIDELFEFNLKEMNEKIDVICAEAYQYRESNPEKGRRILEEDLKQYPDIDILLNNLLYIMNYTNNPDKTITLTRRLIDKTTENDIKYDAFRFLANAYNAKSDAGLSRECSSKR